MNPSNVGGKEKAASSTSEAAELPGSRSGEQADAEGRVGDLKQKTTRGALVSTGALGLTLVMRTGSMMILSRLLLKEDFGLVNMVTAFTGFLSLFRDAGLSMATVQRDFVSEGQRATLFWANLAVGAALAVASVLAAPVLATFYGQPKLLWVTAALGASFLFYGASAQHRAMLQRAMRFGTLALVDISSLVVSTAVGIGLAWAGWGPWALVAMTVALPAATVVGVWLPTRWIPGPPRRGTGVRSMLWFGGTVTLNTVIMYLAYNADKVLLGRFFGVEALGVYGRAYQLVNLPTESLNSTIGTVGFPALSRMQNDPQRLRTYFLKGYSLFLSVVMPITVGCALFAEDIVRVFLGAKWSDAAVVFRLLAPTILAFALINPLAWLMLASGHALRSLKIAFVIAPLIIASYVLGLRGGPQGVALAFSAVMVLLAPLVAGWAKRGTLVTTMDILRAIAPAALSVLLGALGAFLARGLIGRIELTFPRLVVESSVLFGIYGLVLLFGMGQKAVYLGLLRDASLLPGRRQSPSV
jgi:PST family polysaccharide transporter